VFIFFLQLRETLHGGRVYVFTILVLITWALWFVKAGISRRYRPWTKEYETTASVVIPVVDEPVGLFHEVLDLIAEQSPHQVIVVINGPRNLKLEKVCDAYPGIEWTWTSVPGKRNAIDEGLKRCTGEIIVLVDSDTIWTPGTLSELVKPFANRKVGGVTTNQRIIDYDRNILTRWADWLESIRIRYSMPAMSVLGQVGCLPGRTIAFRRFILDDAMPAFLNARFLGVFLEVSDDRTLTNLCLQQGYRTVYQSTSLVYTDAPVGMHKLAKQQLRWARGSQYNTLRMLPWMVRNSPMLAVFYISDIVMPFLLLAAATGFIYRVLNGDNVNFYEGITFGYGPVIGTVLIVVLTLVATWISAYLRQSRHFDERPRDLFLLPVFTVLNTFMLMPIRIYGFMRMAKNDGWGTRRNAFDGDAAKARPNPLAAIPYLLAFAFVFVGVAYHG
jgi:cellulose synthase/poly-beta-1,6-N-acetylglucosamine synthase-like glycosyltransferase